MLRRPRAAHSGRSATGGMKQSGVGREGGDEALRFYTEAKNVFVGLPSSGD
jgi:acyl-CoA reductase-like NAD-dependent aldehyde dehydrogenase